MDDEVLGCGGTILRHVKSGHHVFVCFIANRVYNHQFDEQKTKIDKRNSNGAQKTLGYKESVFFDLPDERLDVCIQDILIPLENYISQVKPHTVYCPFRGDNNQDHRAVFNAVRVAVRPFATRFVNKFLMYEVPSSTEQSPPLMENVFMPNYYVNIKATIGKKVEAFKCYGMENRKGPHPRSVGSLRARAKMRGMEIGFDYAEAFMILREKWE